MIPWWWVIIVVIADNSFIGKFIRGLGARSAELLIIGVRNWRNRRSL